MEACDHHLLGQVLPLLSHTNEAKEMNPSTMLKHSYFLSVSSEQAEVKEMDSKLIIPLRAGEGNNRHLMVQPDENVADKRSSVNSKDRRTNIQMQVRIRTEEDGCLLTCRAKL